MLLSALLNYQMFSLFVFLCMTINVMLIQYQYLIKILRQIKNAALTPDGPVPHSSPVSLRLGSEISSKLAAVVSRPRPRSQ